MKLRQSAAGRTRLSEVGEDSLLDRILPLLPVGPRVIAGSGDDAAIVAAPSGNDLVVLKTDCIVERVHFASETLPAAIGWKAMMRPLSDFAAVSAIPEFALVTLIVKGDKKVAWINGIYRGLSRAAGQFGVSIVGGETSSTSGPTAVSVSVAGRVEKKRWVSRHGGKPGDRIFVTGHLGRSIRNKHLRFVPRIAESRWLTAYFRIHAMMDLSDGLGADLPRLAKASKCGFEVDGQALPLTRGASVDSAINDGEDYELLFTLASRDSTRLQTRWRKKFPRLVLTRIGTLVSQTGPIRPTGSLGPSQLKGGYVHFR
jgi:thiamine-monophosphate kinase